MFKASLTPEEHAALPADAKEYYAPGRGGNFEAQVEGINNFPAWLNAVERIKQETAEAQDEVRRLRLVEILVGFAQEREEITKAHAAECTEVLAEIGRCRIDAALSKAIRRASGDEGLLADIVRPMLRVNSDKTISVIGRDGKPRLDAQGFSLTLDGLLASMRESQTYRGAFATPRPKVERSSGSALVEQFRNSIHRNGDR